MDILLSLFSGGWLVGWVFAMAGIALSFLYIQQTNLQRWKTWSSAFCPPCSGWSSRWSQETVSEWKRGCSSPKKPYLHPLTLLRFGASAASPKQPLCTQKSPCLEAACSALLVASVPAPIPCGSIILSVSKVKPNVVEYCGCLLHRDCWKGATGKSSLCSAIIFLFSAKQKNSNQTQRIVKLHSPPWCR